MGRRYEFIITCCTNAYGLTNRHTDRRREIQHPPSGDNKIVKIIINKKKWFTVHKKVKCSPSAINRQDTGDKVQTCGSVAGTKTLPAVKGPWTRTMPRHDSLSKPSPQLFRVGQSPKKNSPLSPV